MGLEKRTFTNQFGCFTGDKLDKKVTETSEQITNDESAQIVYGSDRAVISKSTLAQMRYEDLGDLIEYVNKDENSKWKAHFDERYTGMTMG